MNVNPIRQSGRKVKNPTKEGTDDPTCPYIRLDSATPLQEQRAPPPPAHPICPYPKENSLANKIRQLDIKYYFLRVSYWKESHIYTHRSFPQEIGS